MRSCEYDEQRLTRSGRTEEAREPSHCSAGVDNLAMEDSLPSSRLARSEVCQRNDGVGL